MAVEGGAVYGPPGMPDSLAGIRVLVVEDHTDSRDMLEEALQFLKATVTTARTAEAAAARLAEADVVVTDYALPGHDGIWLLDQINSCVRPVPVILVSGFAATQVPAVAEAVFALKLLKPVDPFELGRQIALVMRQGSGSPGP